MISKNEVISTILDVFILTNKWDNLMFEIHHVVNTIRLSSKQKYKSNQISNIFQLLNTKSSNPYFNLTKELESLYINDTEHLLL